MRSLFFPAAVWTRRVLTTTRRRMGWDALPLLRNRDHRVAFLTAALFNIPIAALFRSSHRICANPA